MLGNKYLAAGIGILFILVIAYNVKFFSSKSRSLQTPVAQNAEPKKHLLPGHIKVPERIPEKEDKGRWKRDPFGLQMLSEEEHSESVHLMGIIKRDGKSHALINGKVYLVNDRVGDAIIKEIKKHSIVLLSGGKSREISLDYTVLKEKTK